MLNSNEKTIQNVENPPNMKSRKRSNLKYFFIDYWNSSEMYAMFKELKKWRDYNVYNEVEDIGQKLISER